MQSFTGTGASQNASLNMTHHIDNNIFRPQETSSPLFSQMHSVENSSDYLMPSVFNSGASEENGNKSRARRVGWIAALVVGVTALTGTGLLVASNFRNGNHAGRPIDTTLTARIPVFSLSQNLPENDIYAQKYNTTISSTEKNAKIIEPYSYYRITTPPQRKINTTTTDTTIFVKNNNTDIKKTSETSYHYDQVKKENHHSASEKVNVKLKNFYQNKIYTILFSEVKNITNKNNQKKVALEKLIDLLDKCIKKSARINAMHNKEPKLSACHHQERTLAQKKIETILFVSEIIISNNKLLSNVFFDSIKGPLNRITLSDEDIVKKEIALREYVKKLPALNDVKEQENMPTHRNSTLHIIKSDNMENIHENIKCYS